MPKILKKEYLAPKIFLMEIDSPSIAKKALPGQFIVLRIDEKGERIPLTIAETDNSKGSVTIIFQQAGATTSLLAKLNAGDTILDLLGPLGKPAHIEKIGTVVCVGGGVGIAEIYPVAKAYKEAGNKVISILGARTKELLIYEEKIKNCSDEFYAITDDGSSGRKGFVSDVLKEVLEKEKIGLVSAVGPTIMMKVVCDVTKPYGIKTLVSLNPIMLDATGMCGVCRVTVGGKINFACVDGPEFEGHDVDFNELMSRQKSYLDQEKCSSDIVEGKCRDENKDCRCKP